MNHQHEMAGVPPKRKFETIIFWECEFPIMILRDVFQHFLCPSYPALTGCFQMPTGSKAPEDWWSGREGYLLA